MFSSFTPLSILHFLLVSTPYLVLSYHPPDQFPLSTPTHSPSNNRSISVSLFAELEELARIVDISYCVGTTGIFKPFLCASRCRDFPDFELVTTWNTGALLSDSCGYIALSHPPSPKRIVVAFRGTYSIASVIADLSTIPQPYRPYYGHEDSSSSSATSSSTSGDSSHRARGKCTKCKVHTGFYASYIHTRPYILPHISELKASHPEYALVLVGHSLGGAVAALAGLDFESKGWEPRITTFGEPRIGNEEFVTYLDERFGLGHGETDDMTVHNDDGDGMGIDIATMKTDKKESRYRRVTHTSDPVPLLPLTEWGYRSHAGEIYISKSALPPSVADVELCVGDEDPACIAGGAASAFSSSLDSKLNNGESPTTFDKMPIEIYAHEGTHAEADIGRAQQRTHIPSSRHRTRQLQLPFFAHRDYFSRLGTCLPGVRIPRDRYT